MAKQIYIKYTPFGELKEGDEFIRLGGRPVLLSDIKGKRKGGDFIPSDFGHGDGYMITRMERNQSGGLQEVAA